jgi:hypothetical protein
MSGEVIKVLGRWHQVDDRLRGQTRNGGAANVLDLDNGARQTGSS